MPTHSAFSGPVLLTSSSGGHFTELEIVADQCGVPERLRHWAVPRTRQTEALLDGANVTWMPEVRSRGFRAAARNLRAAFRLQRELEPELVISTGAAQTVPHMVAADVHGTQVSYHESVARLDGPSVTGRIAAHLRHVELLAPQPGWGGRWTHVPDVFTRFVAAPRPGATLDRVMVALGTERFSFARAVRQVDQALGNTLAITWQIGTTTPDDGIERNRWLRPEEFEEAMSTASVVITHGGAGSVLTALAAGKIPVVLPRSAAYGEHCDDHQVRMCELLADRGLVVAVAPGEELSRDHVERAAALVALRGGQAGLAESA
jgi:UDP-N-acetylglucosamine transferase subunit ALG13